MHCEHFQKVTDCWWIWKGTTWTILYRPDSLCSESNREILTKYHLLSGVKRRDLRARRSTNCFFTGDEYGVRTLHFYHKLSGIMYASWNVHFWWLLFSTGSGWEQQYYDPQFLSETVGSARSVRSVPLSRDSWQYGAKKWHFFIFQITISLRKNNNFHPGVF